MTKIATAGFFCLATATALAANPAPVMLNSPVDISGDFRAMENFYYLADHLTDFDPVTHSGKIIYQRAQLVPKHAFDNDLAAVMPCNDYKLFLPLPRHAARVAAATNCPEPSVSDASRCRGLHSGYRCGQVALLIRFQSGSIRLQNNPSMERNKSCTSRNANLRKKRKTLVFPLKHEGFLNKSTKLNGGA